MNLLLDTHIWLWSLLQPERLSKRVAKRLSDPENQLWLSPVSVWEAIVLAQKGRIRVQGDPVAWVRGACGVGPFRDAPLTREIALESRMLNMSHEDPADRFIAATARVLELTLVTGDAKLLKLKGLSLMANA